VMIVLAVTLLVAGTVFTTTRSFWLAYRALIHQTERGLSGLRALDDMAVEIARAGFGLGDDLEPLWPGLPGGAPTVDAITVRSNPAGLPGAEREVRFWMKRDGLGAVVLARKATGQAEQVLARHVAELRFEYVDGLGDPVDPALIGLGEVLGGVRIALRLVPDPAGPPVSVPPLSLLVPLESHSATVTFDVRGPVFYRIGVAGIVGQDPTSPRKQVRLRAWKKTVQGS